MKRFVPRQWDRTTYDAFRDNTRENIRNRLAIGRDYALGDEEFNITQHLALRPGYHADVKQGFLLWTQHI